ncbi:MAG: hypothetical protein IJH18_04130 [Bacilli bacterium]|nr:hypothetical protein [Bacilli bacterium]MBQ3469220.1 hypothetical protein [Bacilli bacterium]
MESTVSVKGISEVSKVLRTEINNLTNTYTNLVDEINLLAHTINALKECDGTKAPTSAFGNALASTVMDQSFWDVKIDGYDRVVEYLNSPLHFKILENLDKFNLEPQQLDSVSEEIAKSVKKVEDVLSDNSNLVNINNNFEKIDVI